MSLNPTGPKFVGPTNHAQESPSETATPHAPANSRLSVLSVITNASSANIDFDKALGMPPSPLAERRASMTPLATIGQESEKKQKAMQDDGSLISSHSDPELQMAIHQSLQQNAKRHDEFDQASNHGHFGDEKDGYETWGERGVDRLPRGDSPPWNDWQNYTYNNNADASEYNKNSNNNNNSNNNYAPYNTNANTNNNNNYIAYDNNSAAINHNSNSNYSHYNDNGSKYANNNIRSGEEEYNAADIINDGQHGPETDFHAGGTDNGGQLFTLDMDGEDDLFQLSEDNSDLERHAGSESDTLVLAAPKQPSEVLSPEAEALNKLQDEACQKAFAIVNRLEVSKTQAFYPERLRSKYQLFHQKYNGIAPLTMPGVTLSPAERREVQASVRKLIETRPSLSGDDLDYELRQIVNSTFEKAGESRVWDNKLFLTLTRMEGKAFLGTHRKAAKIAMTVFVQLGPVQNWQNLSREQRAQQVDELIKKAISENGVLKDIKKFFGA